MVSLSCCVTSDKLLSLSEMQFPYRYSEHSIASSNLNAVPLFIPLTITHVQLLSPREQAPKAGGMCVLFSAVSSPGHSVWPTADLCAVLVSRADEEV